MSATHIACLTPPGSGASGAIAVVEVNGPQAWPLARRLFRPASGKPLPEHPAPLATWFGLIGAGAGDEVILAVTAVQSFPIIELHCHGGRQVVTMLLELFQQQGCTPAPAINDIWALLARAQTLRTAAILLDQANGAFDRAVQQIRGHLEGGDSAAARARLDSLARLNALGRHLLTPWRVVIAGPPNVGKSSLLNALAGYQRSVVAPVPGTTRDVVTATLALDGWPVEFSDTAGLREAGDILEHEGIGRAREQIRSADLCLWVIDTAAERPEPVAIELPPERILTVLNKIDLPAGWDLSSVVNGLPVSAATGQGLDQLIRRIVEVLVPELPPAGAAVPFDEECAAVLEALQTEIGRGLAPLLEPDAAR
jgi:tRNA modification GTPase